MKSTEEFYYNITKTHIFDTETLINGILKDIDKINDCILYTKEIIRREPDEFDRNVLTIIRLKRDRTFLEERIKQLQINIDLMNEALKE
jgi:hypothetical protein